MATRQNSTNGKPKSPRIQVVLPELICEQLTILASNESRTVSNMAKVLIQEGIKSYFEKECKSFDSKNNLNTDKFRDALDDLIPKEKVPIPNQIKDILNKPEEFKIIKNDIDDIKSYIMSNIT